MDIDLSEYSLIVASLSGGKDSHCIALETIREARRQKVGHRVLAVHCDTGAEWFETDGVVKDLCRRLEIPHRVVQPTWTVPDYIEHRQKFPSMACRFCTRLKTNAIDKLIRQLYPAKQESKILSVTGERREESTHRAKLIEYERHDLTAGNRQVFHFRPILDWSVGKVWRTIRDSRIPAHPAYTEFGNDRLSCALCVLACEKDIRNGAMARPDLAERYLALERRTGFTFRHKRSLKDILNYKNEQEDRNGNQTLQ